MRWIWTRLKALLRALTVLIALRFPISPSVAFEVSQCSPRSASGEELDETPNAYRKGFGDYLLATAELRHDVQAANLSPSHGDQNLLESEQPIDNKVLPPGGEIPPGPSETTAKAVDAKEQPPIEVSKPEGEEEEERHNLALAKDGAKVIAANKEAKKTSAVLDSDGDTFLKNECKADKWLIIELSQVAKVDTLVISQNELYSSRMREFEVKGRNSHPRTEGSEYGKTLNSSQWQPLGRFNASNTKGVQAFKLEQATWLKYLQIRQISHHGAEAVCALNDVCVFGKSASEDLEDRLAQEAASEASREADPIPTDALQEDILRPSAVPNEAASQSVEDGFAQPHEVPAETVTVKEAQQATKSDAHDQAASTKAPLETRNLSETVIPPDGHPGSPANVNVSTPNAAPGLPIGNQNASSSKPSKPLPEEPSRTNGDTPGKEPSIRAGAEDQLAANTVGSTASRHGGSMYDIIVQELKAIKLNQKDHVRNLTQLQRNVTAVLGRLALEIDLLAARVNRIDPPMPALLPSGDANTPATADTGGRQNCSADEVLDFREPGACRADLPPPQVLKAPTEMEVLQQEVASMKQALASAKWHTDSLLLALAFSFLGGIGVNAAFHSSRGFYMQSILAAFACMPLAIALSSLAGLL